MPRRESGAPLGPVEKKFRDRQRAQTASEGRVPAPLANDKITVRVELPAAVRHLLEPEGKVTDIPEERALFVSDEAVERMVRQIIDQNKSFEQLLGDPESAVWLAEFVARVGTGKKTKWEGLFNRVLSFAETAALPPFILDTLADFFDNNTLRGRWGERQTDINIPAVAEKLGVDTPTAELILAFVMLFCDSHSLSSVLGYQSVGDYAQLKKLGVPRDEADALARIESLANRKKYIKMIEAILKKVGSQVVNLMTPKAVLEFLNKTGRYYWRSGGGLDRELIRNIFGESGKEKAKTRIKELGAEKLNVFLKLAIDNYEEFYGPLSRADFLQLVPDAADKTEFDSQGKLDKYVMWVKQKYDLPLTPQGWQVFMNEQAARTSSFKQPVGREAVQPRTAETTKPNIKIVHEEELLRLRREAARPPEVLRYLFPPTVKPAALPAAGASEAAIVPRAPERGPLPATPETVVFVPLNKQEGEYLVKLDHALDQMQTIEMMSERVRIFLADVWPQFLLARANGAPMDVIVDRAKRTTALLSPSLRPDFERLIVLSADTEANAAAITEAAARLRRNRDLHDQGAYVWTELVSRLRRTPIGAESVQIICTQSYHVDGVRDFEITGGSTRILYAGQRIDQIDRELSAMGINVAGDGEGVVFLEQVKQQVAREVLPHLTDRTELVVTAGKEIHPLHGLTRQALRAEHGAERKVQAAEVYRQQVWSTTVHEMRHEDDRRRGFRGESLGVGRAVAMETTAYLTSLAALDAAGQPSQPLSEVVRIINLHRSSHEGFAMLDFGSQANRTAAAVILVRLAERLGVVGVSQEALKYNHLNLCAEILKAAIQAGGQQVQKLAGEILDEIYAAEAVTRPAAARSAEAAASPATAPPKKFVRPLRPARPALPSAPVTVPGMEQTVPASGAIKLEPTPGRREQWQPGRARRLREAVFALMLTGIAGYGGDASRRPVGEPAGEKALAPVLVERESGAASDKTDQTPPLRPEDKIFAAQLDQEAAQKMSASGLWRYAEYLLNQAGFTPATARDERAYWAAVDTLRNRCLTLLKRQGLFGLSRDTTAEEAEAFEHGIGRHKADELKTVLASLLPPYEVELVVGQFRL